MKLSTKGRYAARAMLDLAIHYDEGPITLKDIAERQDVSERYLENIISKHVSSGLVISSRGKNGGFSLARDPEEIKLGEVINVAEGSLAPVDCVDQPEFCDRTNFCVTYEIWCRLKDSIVETLNKVTLQDMVERYEEKMSELGEPMYYI